MRTANIGGDYIDRLHAAVPPCEESHSRHNQGFQIGDSDQDIDTEYVCRCYDRDGESRGAEEVVASRSSPIPIVVMPPVSGEIFVAAHLAQRIAKLLLLQGALH